MAPNSAGNRQMELARDRTAKHGLGVPHSLMSLIPQFVRDPEEFRELNGDLRIGVDNRQDDGESSEGC